MFSLAVVDDHVRCSYRLIIRLDTVRISHTGQARSRSRSRSRSLPLASRKDPKARW